MGIRNLLYLFKKYAPNSMKETRISDYKNKVLGIDANLMIYKMVYAIRKNGYDIVNQDRIVTHIHGMLQKLIGFKKYNITPIFVFDGLQPKIKSNTLKKRSEFQKAMKKRYDNALTENDKKKYFYLQSDILYQELEDCKKLITIFGYQYIEAIGEADTVLAYLSKRKLVHYVVSDDLDLLIFGSLNLLKDFTVDKNKKINEIDRQKVLKILKINQDQLIDIAIMIGCDYCKSVSGIGPIKAYKIIQDYESLQKAVKHKAISLSGYKNIQKYFKKYKVNKGIKVYKGDTINYGELNTFLYNNNYKLERIKEITKKLNF